MKSYVIGWCTADRRRSQLDAICSEGHSLSCCLLPLTASHAARRRLTTIPLISTLISANNTESRSNCSRTILKHVTYDAKLFYTYRTHSGGTSASAWRLLRSKYRTDSPVKADCFQRARSMYGHFHHVPTLSALYTPLYDMYYYLIFYFHNILLMLVRLLRFKKIMFT